MRSRKAFEPFRRRRLWTAAREGDRLRRSRLDTEDARCDTHSSQNLAHEIGETTAFPIDERIAVFVSPAFTYACVGDDGFPIDFVVPITDLGPYSSTDLFFVADSAISIGNAEGMVMDLIDAPAWFPVRSASTGR